MTAQFPNAETQKKAQHYRLNASEYQKITEILGRPPQGIEWALFSALWSEHCSYKSSKNHLRKFAYRNSRVLEAEGENAGVVDPGEGEKIAFKMESHNHPSFIEPYQGAATGVGGILRDIFTMGARPIALADYLCFGEPKAERMKTLVDGVVAGISGYGNCVGVPTVTGNTEFDPTYNRNILVNAMAVGLFQKDDPIALSKAKGPGNWVVYVGAKTGKDGVHGASMASESFDENSEAKKPNVQIGDPFYEKLLIEACLEILKDDLVVAMQDMGAAGLTSSSFEMSSKGGVGMTMNLDQVPIRDSSITPEEILLSESQERMLLVCEPEKFEAIRSVFARWGLEATHIGQIDEKRQVTLRWKNETLCQIDPDLLVENAPRYDRPYQSWTPKRKTAKLDLPSKFSSAKSVAALFDDVRMGSKEWIYRQYDQRVGLRTARDSRSA
ncbi:MAG TPA: phosphoribosylformylglycinamidine synthase subunit PurL, partial [Pseudobdellovibrionaceae bacterium]|nr:phosphoribosylformylglycinamidine synthase subunit PurL [Pseudobdellovibrionaceae bacterium]